MYLSLLRAPAYAAHPISGRPLVREDRFIPRADRGEHIFSFVVCGGETAERQALIEQEALNHNEAPVVINAFPGGEGTNTSVFMTVSDPRIILTAMKRNEAGDLVIRLFNTGSENCTAQVCIATMKIQKEIMLTPGRFQTYIARGGDLISTEPM